MVTGDREMHAASSRSHEQRMCPAFMALNK